jgi:hypothetical protein
MLCVCRVALKFVTFQIASVVFHKRNDAQIEKGETNLPVPCSRDLTKVLTRLGCCSHVYMYPCFIINTDRKAPTMGISNIRNACKVSLRVYSSPSVSYILKLLLHSKYLRSLHKELTSVYRVSKMKYKESAVDRSDCPLPKRKYPSNLYC